MPTWDELLKPKKKTWGDLIGPDSANLPTADDLNQQMTSSAPKPTEISMDLQMQGPTARKYGMDFDPNLYISDEMPELADLQDPVEKDDVREKVHNDFFISEEQQRVINETAAKQPSLYQGPISKEPPRIDPTLMQPDVKAGEYLMDKLSNESLIGKASILITGTILAGIHGGDPMEYYRDIYDANNETIMAYKPNMLQDMATGFLVVTADLSVFTGTGALYNSATANALKYSTKYVSDQMVKAGMTRTLADSYAKNAVIRLNAMLQSGTTLGTHAGLNDAATQLAEGRTLGTMDWNRLLDNGMRSAELGFSVGALGVGANYFRSTPQFQRVIDGAVNSRLVERGYAAAAFGGEVSLFTYGDALLDGSRRMKDVTAEDLMHGAATIGGLKAMHTRQQLPKSKGMFSATESDALKSYVKEIRVDDPLKSLVETEGAIEKVMADPKVPYSAKAKIAEIAGTKYEMPLVTRVSMIEGPEGARVETRTESGMLVQSEAYASKAEALRTYNSIDAGIIEQANMMEMRRMTTENQVEFDRRLEKAGIENGIANTELIDAAQQLPHHRTAAQKKMVNTMTEAYETLKAEKTEVKEGEAPQKFLEEAEPVVDPVVPAKEVAQQAAEKAEIAVEPKAPAPKAVKKVLKTGENAFTREITKSGEKIGEVTVDETSSGWNVKWVEVDAANQKKGIAIDAYRDLNKQAEKEGTVLKSDVPGKTNDKAAGLWNKLVESGEAIQLGDGSFIMLNKNTIGHLSGGTGVKTASALKATAEKIRGLKGTVGPKPGELGMSILPPKAYDMAFEVAAKAIETTGDVVLAVGKAIDAVKQTTAYQNLSKKEQRRVEEELDKHIRAKLAENTGEHFNQFFEDVSAGTKGFSDVKYEPTLELDAVKHGEFVKNYNRHRGHFDSHISKSIPGHKEIQVVTGKAVTETLPKGGKVLDIGGSENSWAKAVTETSGGKVETVTVDPNKKMKERSDKTSVEGNTYVPEAFMAKWENNPMWKPTKDFDIVHESMMFQFMKGDRNKQIEYIKENVLKKDGLLIMEEKFVPKEIEDVNNPNSEWSKNEAQKDAYKEKYFEKAELTKKKQEVLEGMHERMVPSESFEAKLKQEFDHVMRYWDSGNFKGYAATNSLAKAKSFSESVGTAGESIFSAEPVEFIKGGSGKKPPTAKQKSVQAEAEGKHKLNKVTLQEYTGLKDQIKAQARSAKDIAKFHKEANQQIMDIISSKEWIAGIGPRAAKTMARRVAAIDPTKPESVIDALDYIDKVLNDAKARKEAVEIDKAYTTLEKQTSPKSMVKKENGVAKGKGIDPAYQDKLKKVRQDMIEKDWREAQKEIDKLQEEIGQMKSEDPMLWDHLNYIEELSFHGLLNETGLPTLTDLKSRIADIESIRKEGRTLGAAKRFVKAAERKQRISDVFDVLNAGKRQVELNPEKAANLKTPMHRKVSRWLDWSNLDSYFTLLDKMSRFDKRSTMFNSDLSKIGSEPVFTAERGEFLGTEAQHNTVNTKLSEIYKTKKSGQLKRILDRNTSELHPIEWKYKDIDGKTKSESVDMTMNQIYKRWMELQDPTLKASLTKQGYFDRAGERTGKYDALEKAMTPEARQWAEWQMNEFYPKYHESINEVYREIYGTDMPVHDKYSPIFVADKLLSADAAIDQMFSTNDIRGMAGNSHLKLRTGHAKELLLMDGDQVMMNYINKMEFFKNWAQPLRELNGLFNDRAIRESIRQNFGQDYVDAVDHFMKMAARDPKKLNKFEKASNTLRTNFTLGSLAIKPTVFAKQLTSFPAYADRIPIKEFTKGMADWANPAGWKKITKTLGDSPYIQERYKKGWDRDVALAMQRDAQAMMAGKNSGNFKNAMMFLTKYGDKAAIMYGGWPVYKYHRNQAIKNGMSEADAHQAGLREFEFATRQAQQATGPMDLSIMQNSNPIMKWATMYKTSPLQYHRKVVSAARDLLIDGRNRAESAKTLAIYHVVLPQLFQIVSNGFQWDGEDQLRALKWGSTTGVPIVGDAARGIANHFTGQGHPYKATVLNDLFKTTTRAGDEILDIVSGELGNIDDITFEDIIDSIDQLAKASGSWTGTPADAVQNTMSGIADAINGETNFPGRRILGWSEYSMDNDRYDLLRDMPEDIRRLVERNLNNEKSSWGDLLEDQGNPVTWDDIQKK